MKKTLQFFMVLTLTFFIAQTALNAKEISGSLSAGEGSSFIPMQGSAFSIIKDIKSGIYDAKFNILIKSGGSIIYNEKSQVDDLYLVFNDAIDNGDIIKLDVVNGVFLFKMSHMDKLPEAIVEAIKEQAPQEYARMKKNQKPKAIKKTPVVNQHIEPENYTPAVPLINEPEIPAIVEPIQERQKEGGFFDRLSAKISTLIGRDERPDKAITSKPVPQDISKPIDSEKVYNPTTSQSGIGTLPNTIENVKKERLPIIMSQGKVINSSKIESGIDNITQDRGIQPPKMASSGITSFPVAKTFPMNVDRIETKNQLAQSKTDIDSFATSRAPAIREDQSHKFQTQINTTPQSKPSFQSNVPQFQPAPQLEEMITVPAKTEPDIVKTIEPEIQQPTIIKAPYVKREESKDRIVITKTLAGEKKKEESRVIKRHVEPEVYKSQQKQVTERMSDRIAGNGYGMTTQGSLKVKAFSNKREVSAWVEVFQAGTNKRVKTFYTGKGGSLKNIKLPPGTYVIKATYRTANSKRQKTLGRVVLEEGGSINKSISFNDGSVTVNVRKSGEPIYAKVEVYKSGSKRRIAYEFTSKSTGVVKLSLGSGKYDIIIKDHNNIRRFDGISIRGGKSKSINAEF